MHELLVNRLFKPAQEKSVVRCTDRPAMTIAVDLGRKAKKKIEQSCLICYFGKKRGKICNCRLLQIIGGALRVNLESMYNSNTCIEFVT